MRTIDVDTLERITRDIFVAWKAPREDAAWIAALLVRANLRGHDSHGVIRVPQYWESVKKLPSRSGSPVPARADASQPPAGPESPREAPRLEPPPLWLPHAGRRKPPGRSGSSRAQRLR